MSESGVAINTTLEAISVYPEAKAHVVVKHEVSDSATADVCVEVRGTIGELNLSSTIEQADIDGVNSRRSTSGDGCHNGNNRLNSLTLD